ncbi:YhfX family PLP-dependent enzyme [Alkalibacterium kapii]|uniref:Amino-acid racemase n=1 Tax=Alkalibacterium kapii TaxID=426704 RepID=A0A511ATG3_9LACT|nr:YhfX family PLP-dependent enzyme [Alkalibacterium kapii]GEK91002.1 amino-acid racemase [Alkalibacterium kapii]
MFLEMVKKRNPELIDYAVSLHQQGIILPDTYVIDLDKIKENATKMAAKAKSLDIELYFMTKQIGRNPKIAETLIEAGIKKAVVVDYREAEVMMKHNIPIGNVGHLVQLPTHFIKKVMAYGVDYITVYSVEKLRQINAVAEELNMKQKIMLRVIDEGDALYPGQYGGFQLDELNEIMDVLKSFAHCDITGLTSFPCILYDKELKDFKLTQNVKTLKKAKQRMQASGFDIQEMNVPSATSIKTLPLFKEMEGTQGEPGHALSGTSPMHAEVELEEKPAYVYVSEISHNSQDSAFVYGGGYYARGNLENVLIDDEGKRTESSVEPFPSDNIDYYLEIDGKQTIGATAIMAARTQIFVTRSRVALVKGLNDNKPELVGIYTSQGSEEERI